MPEQLIRFVACLALGGTVEGPLSRSDHRHREEHPTDVASLDRPTMCHATFNQAIVYVNVMAVFDMHGTIHSGQYRRKGHVCFNIWKTAL